MRITALGHSCVLLDLCPDDPAQHTRILVDPWLSDHATGDAMGRFPRLRFDMDVLAPVHAVYLSHAHCDHLDPYTLVRLWRALPEAPTLILPETLRFLVPVFEQYLDGVDILLLPVQSATPFRGVRLLGLLDPGDEAGNEDDVMVLVVTGGSDCVLVEADARLSLEHPEFRQYVAMLLQAPGVDSAVWLTTENELTGTMLGRTCSSVDARLEVAELAAEELLAHVDQLYAPVDAEWGLPGLLSEDGVADDPWQVPHLLRLVHGQGLCMPHMLDPRWHSVLFPVRVSDRVALERQVAMDRAIPLRIDSLEVGAVHHIDRGQLVSRTPLAGLTLLDAESSRDFDPDTSFFPSLPCAPIWPEGRDPVAQRERISGLLNERFLPFLHGQRRPPVVHLIAAHGGEYRVRVHFGLTVDEDVVDFVLGYGARGFVAGAPSAEDPPEAYWANDLEDFLEGRCDEFSPTCRTGLPSENLRLWTSLAAPLLNSDLQELRVRRHFQRAVQGKTADGWVRAMVMGETEE